MIEERSRLAVEDRERASVALSSMLAGLPELQAATARGDCVAGFAPTRSEIDPCPALDQARRGGAGVAWPRVTTFRNNCDVNHAVRGGMTGFAGAVAAISTRRSSRSAGAPMGSATAE